MPTQRRMFMPADGLAIRDPLSDNREHGNIMNPRRYSEFGGLKSGGARGFYASTATVKSPESTQRRVPVK